VRSRAWLLFLCACGSFEASKDAPADDAGPTTKSKDAGSDVKPAAPDAGPTCRTVIEQPFAQNPLAGWTGTRGAGTLGIATGPMDTPALRLSLSVGAGGGGANFVERDIDGLAPVSGKASFDFAYDSLARTSAFGCAFGLRSKAPFAEARIVLEFESSGLNVVGGFSNESGAVDALEAHAPVKDPGPGQWTRVTFAIALGSGGVVTRSATVGGETVSLPSFTPPATLALDGVHLTCGLLGLSATDGPATVDLFVKDLVVETCAAPAP
jgi:hypothetical protein